MTAEQKEQINLIRWTQQPDVRQKYPELKLLYHVPNERQCSPRQGKLLKMMGVKEGVPDLCLPVARGGYHGLYVEMKSPEKSARASENQIWWVEALISQNYAACVCKGWKMARDTILRYMEMEDEQ